MAQLDYLVLGLENVRSHPRPTQSEPLGMGSRTRVLTSLPCAVMHTTPEQHSSVTLLLSCGSKTSSVRII